MTTTSLFLFGTPARTSDARARQVLGSAVSPSALPPEALPTSAGLVVVDSPVRALASALAAQPALDVDAWIAQWRQGAFQLLQAMQRLATPALAVPALALWTAPAEVLGACRGRFADVASWPAQAVAPVAPPALDPLWAAVAEAAVSRDRVLRSLSAELSLLCLPLGGAETAPSAAAAQRRLSELDVGAALRQRLERTEVELEKQFLAAQAATARADAAIRSNAAQGTQAVQAAHAAEKERLQAQLRVLREELESYYVTCEQLKQAGAAAGAGGDVSLAIGRVVPLGTRDEDPHRECAFELHQVRHGERAIGTLRLRLVEHHGHAGLVLLPVAGGVPPLQRFVESGREGDQAYALFIPSDANTHAVFDALSATDWRLLLALASRLGGIVSELSVDGRWGQVARRFLQQVRGLPARLRFDGVQVASAREGGATAFEFRFDEAACGEVVTGPLRLRWRPEGTEREAAASGWLDVAVPDPVWPSWPRRDDGRPVEWLSLPLGRAAQAPAARAAWHALTPPDREAAIGLLRGLPDVIARAPADAWPAGVPRDALRAGAAITWLETRRRLDASPVRRAARALLGRDVHAR